MLASCDVCDILGWLQPPEVAQRVGVPGDSFAPPVYYALHQAVTSIAAGDLDGDGDVDLALTTGVVSSSAGWSVLLNNANGTFAQGHSYSRGNRPGSVALSDFDNDGDLDVALGIRYGPDVGVSIALNEGDATFPELIHHDINGFGNRPASLVAGDLDGDGRIDLAMGSKEGVAVLFNEGNGIFSPPVRLGSGFQLAVALGDVDGDSLPDLVATKWSESAISVMLNRGDRTFAEEAYYRVGDNSEAVALGDLDGDGDLDVAFVQTECCSDLCLPPPHGYVATLLNKGDGAFGTLTRYPIGYCPDDVAVDDLDGDGHLDLATLNGRDVSVLLNRGDGSFAEEVYYPVDGRNGVMILVDVDGDNDNDIAVNDGDVLWGPENGGVFVLLNQIR
jgi:hypothetical protein